MTVLDDIMALGPSGPGPSGPGPRDRRPASPGAGNPSSDRSDGGAAPADRQTRDGRPDWLNTQLRRLYDDVVAEPVPDDLLELVRRLEQGDAGKAPSGDARGSDPDGAASDPTPSSPDRW
ncbi:MAG: hypothetical protein GVY28_02745 [Alphaproteobacteria bacterium]|jgi:hypothetical protein|nr:hypothetical protein [Alphaproteobacteria bacterium]